MNVVKLWRCKAGHGLGLVVRNGGDVPQLMVFREAIDAGAERPAEVDVMMGPVTGTMVVRCSVCEDVQVWRVSVEALLHLVEELPIEQVFDFWRRLLEKARR